MRSNANLLSTLDPLSWSVSSSLSILVFAYVVLDDILSVAGPGDPAIPTWGSVVWRWIACRRALLTVSKIASDLILISNAITRDLK